MNETTGVSGTGWTGYTPLDQPDASVATVRSGETSLRDVASRLNVDLASLIDANPQIQRPDQLKAGQDVRLPETSAPAPGPGSDGPQEAQSTPALPSGDPMSATLGKMSLPPNANFTVDHRSLPAPTTAPATPLAPTRAAQAQVDALGQAAASGDLKKVQELVAAGADINGRDSSNQQTALLRAVASGKSDVAKYLLSKNADPNIADVHGKFPLHAAASGGDPQMVKTLRDNGALVNVRDEGGNTPLMDAADKGDVKTINALTSGKVGADVNLKGASGSTALMNAVRSGNPDAVKALLDKSNLATTDDLHRNALGVAAREGNAECAKALLGKVAGLDPKTRAGIVNNRDTDGRTALMNAIQKDHTDTAQQLMASKDLLVDVGDNEGKTALQYAAEKGSVKDLLARGANPNRADIHGVTPLIAAAQNGHAASVKALLQNQQNPAKPDMQDADHRTALMYAAQSGDLRAVQALVNAGAGLDLTDKNGRTAYDLAKAQSVNSPSADYQKILDLVTP